MKLKIRICAIALAALSLCSCGKQERATLNYEQPVSTLTCAAEYSDTSSYLSCFTPEAKAAYEESEEYNPSLAEALLTRGDDKDGCSLEYKITDKQELDKSDISELERQYKNSYRKNITVKKAMKLNVTFSEKLTDKTLSNTREITVVKIENSWLIFGEVITDFKFK